MGSIQRRRRGKQLGFSENLEEPNESYFAPWERFARGRVHHGGHPLWRRVFIGAGSAALGRHFLAHGFGDCWWCHDEAH